MTDGATRCHGIETSPRYRRATEDNFALTEYARIMNPMTKQRGSASKTLIRTFLLLALAAAGVQAFALMIDGNVAGTNSAEGWDTAGAARLNGADMWPQLGALLGAGGRVASTAFQLPNIWDTTSAFIAADNRAVVRAPGVATGTLEAPPEPPPLPPRAPNFAAPIPPALAAAGGLAAVPSPAVGPLAVLLDEESSPTPAPVPLPPALWLAGPALLSLVVARRRG
jgi:hypothetical protein